MLLVGQGCDCQDQNCFRHPQSNGRTSASEYSLLCVYWIDSFFPRKGKTFCSGCKSDEIWILQLFKATFLTKCKPGVKYEREAKVRAHPGILCSPPFHTSHLKNKKILRRLLYLGLKASFFPSRSVGPCLIAALGIMPLTSPVTALRGKGVWALELVFYNNLHNLNPADVFCRLCPSL